jgi:hypothetical protein
MLVIERDILLKIYIMIINKFMHLLHLQSDKDFPKSSNQVALVRWPYAFVT